MGVKVSLGINNNIFSLGFVALKCKFDVISEEN